MRRTEKRTRSFQPMTDCTPQPSDYEIGSLESRAAARALLVETQKRVRLVFFVIGQPLNLETSTCERSWWPDGTLYEQVLLDRTNKDLTQAALDEFVSRFPIETLGERNSVYGQGGGKRY